MKPANPPRQVTILAIVLAILALVGLAGWWYASTGRLVVHMPSDTQVYTLQVVNQADGQTVRSASPQDQGDFTARLPRGSYELRVFSSNSQSTSYFVDVPGRLAKAEQAVTVQNQADRQKLARRVDNCPLLVAGQLYSYTCGFSNVLHQFSPVTAQKFSTAQNLPVSGIMSAGAYRDGILALRLSNQSASVLTVPVLSFIKNGRVVSEKTLPKSFISGSESNAVYQLALDDQSDSFAVTKKDSGLVAVAFKSFESEPTTPSTGLGSDLGNQVSSVTITKRRLLLAVGSSAEAVHQDDAPQPASTDTRLFVFDLDKLSSTPQTYTINSSLKEAYLCGSGYVCALQSDRLNVYSISGDQLTLVFDVNNVDDLLASASGTFYVQSGHVYKLDVSAKIATMLMNSEGFNIESLAPANDGVLVNATQKGDTAKSLHSFLLSTKPASKNSFADSKLPYQRGQVSKLWDMDYSGRTVLISLLLNSATLDRQTNTVTYDQSEYNTVTKDILKQLSKDGVSLPDYSITFQVTI